MRLNQVLEGPCHTINMNDLSSLTPDLIVDLYTNVNRMLTAKLQGSSEVVSTVYLDVTQFLSVQGAREILQNIFWKRFWIRAPFHRIDDKSLKTLLFVQVKHLVFKGL